MYLQSLRSPFFFPLGFGEGETRWFWIKEENASYSLCHTSPSLVVLQLRRDLGVQVGKKTRCVCVRVCVFFTFLIFFDRPRLRLSDVGNWRCLFQRAKTRPCVDHPIQSQRELLVPVSSRPAPKSRRPGRSGTLLVLCYPVPIGICVCSSKHHHYHHPMHMIGGRLRESKGTRKTAADAVLEGRRWRGIKVRAWLIICSGSILLMPICREGWASRRHSTSAAVESLSPLEPFLSFRLLLIAKFAESPSTLEMDWKRVSTPRYSPSDHLPLANVRVPPWPDRSLPLKQSADTIESGKRKKKKRPLDQDVSRRNCQLGLLHTRRTVDLGNGWLN